MGWKCLLQSEIIFFVPIWSSKTIDAFIVERSDSDQRFILSGLLSIFLSLGEKYAVLSLMFGVIVDELFYFGELN